ncbi:nuclear transport factor 2 family protein [Sphingomonas sp. R647]|uniref:nuclear transport factor 2 family protein n=1 Tax=Sphingomonas sp. R647 TaxID=2875233 RepID=UPI001CD55E7C|nr:nuclear transport factor 2 family protein [Sphingomonas sp. R647]MCA1199648.1 nuclear transport factor 2 family protein [Sphingomonas sp. R647]
MPVQLPKAIAAYFAADRKGQPQATSECFMPEAVVIDEGNRYVGRDAICQWMANASTQYSYTVEPFDVAGDDGRIIVTSHLVGNFPGSPVDLRYCFVLDGDSIAQLEIVP